MTDSWTYEIQITYVVIGSFSHELQMIYVAGARTTDIWRSRGFTRFRVYSLTEPPKRTYEIQMTYVVIGSFSHELQIIYVAGARTADIRRSRGFTGFLVYFLIKPPKRTYEILMSSK